LRAAGQRRYKGGLFLKKPYKQEGAMINKFKEITELTKHHEDISLKKTAQNTIETTHGSYTRTCPEERAEKHWKRIEAHQNHKYPYTKLICE
jgi:hypothetical protein